MPQEAFPASEFERLKLRRKIRKIGETLRADISPQAVRTLAEIAYAANHDPHPSWQAERLKPEFKERTQEFKVSSDYVLEQFQSLLAKQRSKTSERHPTITTFDVLHMISIRLEDLCPFSKK